MNRISLLENKVMEYTWGSKSFIPELLGNTTPVAIPQAEMWMGSHKKAPSKVINDDSKTPLDIMIENHPKEILGKEVSDNFSKQLPFLFKVLSASKPLSIQAHPDKKQALAGFNKENSKKIPIDATHRNYRDNNHKPELICALTTMWALKGFREPKEILSLLKPLHGISDKFGIDILKKQPDEYGIKAFFNNLMNMDINRASELIKNTVDIIQDIKDKNTAYEWIDKLNQEYPKDIGTLSPLFLNVVKLNPGEALYLPARELHAYLLGSGLEIMANSDNVLRGGLTPKHIDLPELMNVLNFTPGIPEIINIRKSESIETFFPSPAKEFILSVINLPDEHSQYKIDRHQSVEILLCTKGKAMISDISNGEDKIIQKGASMLVPASVKKYSIEGKATIYKASVPL